MNSICHIIKIALSVSMLHSLMPPENVVPLLTYMAKYMYTWHKSCQNPSVLCVTNQHSMAWYIEQKYSSPHKLVQVKSSVFNHLSDCPR